MKEIINYIIEANVALLLFLVTFRLVLERETNFRFQRFFLLAAVLLSLTFPLLHLNIGQYTALPSISNAMPAYGSTEVMPDEPVRQEVIESMNSGYNVWQVAACIYVAGVVLLTFSLLYQLAGLFITMRQTSGYKVGNFKIIEVAADRPSFSFFNLICIGGAHMLTATEKQMIIRHESVHATQWHSLDMFVVTLLKIVFWFNPLIHVYKRILIRLHEFEADAGTVSIEDMDHYCSLLAKVTLQGHFPIASHFNHSLTLKRIEMMRTIKRKMHPGKMVMLAAITPIMFFMVSCQELMTGTDEPERTPVVATPDLPRRVQQRLNYLKESYPLSKFTLVELDGNADLKAESRKKSTEILEAIKGTGYAAMVSTHSVPVSRQAFLKTGFKYRKFMIYGSHLRKGEKDGEHTFLVVSANAHPLHGMDELQSYLKENLNYPKKARALGIKGKVHLEFIVEKDGKLSNIQVTNGIGYGCDEEAVRVLSSSGPWIAGRQDNQDIRQRMVLSVPFSLK